MILNSKITGGLAWAGLVLVLAVPSADMLTKPSAKTVTLGAGADATETASIAPAAKPVVSAVKPVAPATAPVATAAAEPDVIEDYVSSGKKLPSYISDAPVTTAQAPAATKPLAVPTAPATAPVAADGRTEVASFAPVPYPASMRPRPVTTATVTTDEQSPLILDEEAVAQREATLRAVEPVLADEPTVIGDDQLQEWDSGSLADYLERRGLISEAEQARPVDSDYDPDGFFLSDGPNRSEVRVVRRIKKPEFFLF